MIQAVIADDEIVILNGLKRLIDWEAMGVTIVGEAQDGEQLESLIAAQAPGLVISDVRMPEKTGLEVMESCLQTGNCPLFIFISGYQEFTYAQQALQMGAVDYLLKPVRAEDLKNAVRKAAGRAEDQKNPLEYQQNEDEVAKLFMHMNEDDRYEGESLYRIYQELDLDPAGKNWTSLCIGIRPDQAAELSRTGYERYQLIRFAVYNRLGEYFREKKLGFVVKRDDYAIHIMGLFPEEGAEDLYCTYLKPLIRELESTYLIGLVCGIGMPVIALSQMKNSYKTAQHCFELYFFLEEPVIDFSSLEKEFTDTEKDYDSALSAIFPAIVARDGSLETCVTRMMDLIYDMHFGHRMAARTRVMMFTGDVSSKLSDLRMIRQDFYRMQDDLQNRVAEAVTFGQIRSIIREYFLRLEEDVLESGRGRESLTIEEVKKHIQLHYMEDISIKKLSEIACVSQNYFSAMFKKETGENYKAYLTRVRMDAAIRLLQETDDHTYEIGEKVGYNNVRRFVEGFKKIYKVTPAEYRQRLRGEDSK